MEKEEELGTFITNFYISLFMSTAGPQPEDILQFVPESDTLAMNEHLTKPFSGGGSAASP